MNEEIDMNRKYTDVLLAAKGVNQSEVSITIERLRNYY